MGERQSSKDVRVSSVLHRNLNESPPIACKGAHSQILGADGEYYFDLSAGAGVLCLGYSMDRVKDAMSEQLRLPYLHAGQWSCEPVEKFADLLLSMTYPGAVMFLNGGGEAIEAACKLAVQYCTETNRSGVPQYFAREHSYHGNSMFCLALGDHPKKNDYRLSTPHLNLIRFPAYVDAATTWDLARLEAGLRTCHALCYPAIVVLEPIGGTTLGIEPGNAEYLADIRELCTRYGAVLIYDEVLCGNFRTGRLFAWQYYQDRTTRDVAPDITVTGKGLTAGYFPLSAVIANEKIMRALRNGSGRLWHSTTNQNHPIGCATALVAMDEYLQRSAHTQCAIQSVMTGCGLVTAPLVKAVKGVGALWGLHLDPDLPGLHLAVKRELRNKRIACYTDGATGNHVMIAPSYDTYALVLDRVLKQIDEVLCTIAYATAGGDV